MKLRLKLTNKLSLLIILGIVGVVFGLGIYFDSFLKDTYLQDTKKRMQHGFGRLITDIDKIEKELKLGIAFVQNDGNFIASIYLVNSYQDKKNYNSILLDEEKKIIAKQLLDKVKLSFNNDIALYDQWGELIAFVTKEQKGYELNFISYEKGEAVLFNKLESDEVYTKKQFNSYKLMPYKHIAYYKSGDATTTQIITYHLNNQDIFIKSHQNIIDKSSGKINAHIEMTQILGKEYFNLLSSDLDMKITKSTKHEVDSNPIPLFDTSMLEKLKILQNDENYLSEASLLTKEGKIYIIAILNKDILKMALNNNRAKLLLLLIFSTVFVLTILRYLLNRSLTFPLNTLMKQINKIERQDYSSSKIVPSGDELETISTNINHLALVVQERESELKESQENLKYLSDHDPLTNLPNRRFFMLRLEHALDIAQRKNAKLALLFLDLDQFKNINDTLGHNIGDELLLGVSKRLSHSIRHIDTLARLGGDEFIILVENISAVSDVESITQKLIDDFQEAFICGNHELTISASIGIALYPEDGTDSLALIKNADLAMYKSKDKGRNNYSFFSQELSNTMHKRTSKINALKYAIKAGNEFILYYQPKISLVTGKIVAVEALIRWDSAEFGFLTPDQFISFAEETNLIIPIGSWVLHQACADFVKLQRQGYELEHISINVSNIQLKYEKFLGELQEILAQTQMNPHKLELEITESYIATNANQALKLLQRLRDMGINLAIDDFGTGYSSMKYLQKLPVTRLKIDKTFIDNLPDSPASIAIVKAIISLAKSFNLFITAEGVEQQKQLTFLIEAKCDEVQGYLYAEPLSLDELKRFIVEQLYKKIVC